MSATDYDAVIIGSGQGGGPLAGALAAAGWKTALVERTHVGGTCINEGCTPTKTMVASGRVAYLARRAADYGVATGQVSVDMEVVRKRKRDIVDSFRGGSEKRLNSLPNLDVIMGDAHFLGPQDIAISLNDGGERLLRAPVVVINTGARPASPDLPGLDAVAALDSTSIMELDAVPEHLIVVGGGYIGLEFGQMFRRFGSRVTVVQRGSSLMAREDSDICAAVAEIMTQDGIDILYDANTVDVVPTVAGGLDLALELPDGRRVLTGSHLLLAAGRSPNTDTLAADRAGIELDARGFVKVDDHLRTSVPGIYAIGDVNGGPAFTHISYDDFRILKANLLDGADRSTRGRLVPYTMFIDPQLGRVGLSEREAVAAGVGYKVAKMPMEYVARALETDESRGFMKALVDPESGQILGAAVLGIEGGEIMAQIQIAMLGGIPYTVLRDAVFAHPTLAESLNNLFANLT